MPADYLEFPETGCAQLVIPRSGDSRGNAPQYHTAQQYTIDPNTMPSDRVQVRQYLRIRGITWCRSCQGYHK
jgi:hypothetical protein